MRFSGSDMPFGGFLKWWYPTIMGFPTKNDHFGVFWGYHHLRKHPFGLEGRMHLNFKLSIIDSTSSLTDSVLST